MAYEPGKKTDYANELLLALDSQDNVGNRMSSVYEILGNRELFDLLPEIIATNFGIVIPKDCLYKKGNPDEDLTITGLGKILEKLEREQVLPRAQ